MKAAKLIVLKSAVFSLSTKETQELILKLARFKVENKEYLTYLLFESYNEEEFVAKTKDWLNDKFNEINFNYYYTARKSIRKILKELKKLIRFSKINTTEIELLLNFCLLLKTKTNKLFYQSFISNMYSTQLKIARRKWLGLHPDFQIDFESLFEQLNEQPYD